ncbi:MAG TPA: sensor histidine kinase [Actinomycetota bacterium]|nr:sensor histidine kinase [Actinomycetota bacterium]
MRWWGWRIWLGIGVGLCAAYYVVPPAPAKLVVWPVIGASSAGAIVVGTRWHRPNPASAWYLLAGALVALTTGDTLYNVRVRLLHSGQVFPSVVDLCYLLTYPLLILGLLLLIRRRSPGRDIPSLIDAAIIAIGIGLLSWVFLIAPYVHAGELSLAQRLVSIAYPLGDVLVLAVAIRLAIGTGRRHPAWWLLAIAILAVLVADSLFLFLQLNGTWQVGGPVDIGWIAFYVGCGAAALHPSMVELSRAEPTSMRMSRARLVLVAGAALLAPAVLVIQAARGEPVDTTLLAVVTAALFLLSMARMRGLTSELHAQQEHERIIQQALNATKNIQDQVAADLQDGPARRLAMLVGELAQVRAYLQAGSQRDADTTLAKLENDIADQIANLRRQMSELRPPVEQFGIVQAIRSQVDAFTNATGVPCTVEAIDRYGAELPSDVETALLRVTQEALTNVRKHARATHVFISLEVDEELIRLQIHDNGAGFEATADASRLVQLGRYGLANLHEWVEMAGGQFSVSSSLGHGTTVTAIIEPVPQPAPS